MKIFGISAMSLLALAIVFWLGTKFPNVLKGVPIVG